MYYVMYVYTYTANKPRILLRPYYSQQGVIAEATELVCLIAISGAAQSSSVSLSWNHVRNNDCLRVVVIPTTITTDDSIGIIYTTVIQFKYLSEADEGYYTCSMMIDENLIESTFYFKIIGKYVHMCACTYVKITNLIFKPVSFTQ